MDRARRRERDDDRWPVPFRHRTQMHVRDLRAWTGERFSASLFLSLHDMTAPLPFALPFTSLVSFFGKLRDITIFL
jgi:hypothetical protein